VVFKFMLVIVVVLAIDPAAARWIFRCPPIGRTHPMVRLTFHVCAQPMAVLLGVIPRTLKTQALFLVRG